MSKQANPTLIGGFVLGGAVLFLTAAGPPEDAGYPDLLRWTKEAVTKTVGQNKDVVDRKFIVLANLKVRILFVEMELMSAHRAVTTQASVHEMAANFFGDIGFKLFVQQLNFVFQLSKKDGIASSESHW